MLISNIMWWIHRGCYKATWRYDISLCVSRVSAANEWNIFHHPKRKFVSPSGHVMFLHTNEIPNYFSFAVKCVIYFICSHSNSDLFTREVKDVILTCEDYHVFARKFTWYFTGVYKIYNFIWCEDLLFLDQTLYFRKFTHQCAVSSHNGVPLSLCSSF